MALPREAMPPYLRLANDIRDKIRRGELKPGDRVPSSKALASEFDVAVMTAQKAVRWLCDEGWAVSTPSVGVFVNEQPPDERTEEATATALLATVNRLVDQFAAVEARLTNLEGAVYQNRQNAQHGRADAPDHEDHSQATAEPPELP